MGDFSLSCGATGVSLMHDPVALIPLIKAPNYGVNVDCGERGLAAGAHLVTNDWVEAFYRPAALPIFGVMDSYGRLEEIEEDENTRFIEKVTGVKIVEFAEYCSCGLRGDLDRKLAAKVKAIKKAFGGPLRGMIVHRKAWDKMTTSFPEEYDGSPAWSMWDNMHGFPATALEMIGFVEKDKTKDERYNRKFVHPRMPRVVGECDGNYTHFKVNGRDLSSIFSVKKLASQRGVNLPKADCDVAKRTPASLPQVMRNSLDPWRCESSVINIYESEILDQESKDVDRLVDKMEASAPDRRLVAILEARLLGKVKIKKGFFLDGMATMSTFCMYLGSINRLLQPTWNGPQYGNHYAVAEIARLAASICEEKITPRPRPTIRPAVKFAAEKIKKKERD
jgi:hypothetical protein